ncbi:MAG: twin-arginine translocase subunit TatB [Endozoicomonadaceae bacterium]|nr:twin-arginine translocase subunit TatB [Endozoicomonadaceae bacterium]
MFDIGFFELLVVVVVALIVLGPERLPVAIKVSAVWVGRLRRTVQSIQQEIEKEINMDEVRRDIHNESVMAELKKSRDRVQKEVEDLNRQIDAAEDTSTLSDSSQLTAANGDGQTDNSGSKIDP